MEQQKPQVDTINAAFGGYGKGLDKAIDLILEKLWSLKSVGVSFIIIAHVKRTDVTDVMSEEQYSMLTASTTQKYFNAIKTKLDFLGIKNELSNLFVNAVNLVQDEYDIDLKEKWSVPFTIAFALLAFNSKMNKDKLLSIEKIIKDNNMVIGKTVNRTIVNRIRKAVMV